MSKLHAEHYADSMVQLDSSLERNDLIGESTYLVRVAAPEVAQRVQAGQFVMIRLSGTDAPLIGRALAVYDIACDESGVPTFIDLVYIRKGTFTTALAASPLGTGVTLWGPLGNGFAEPTCDRLIMAAGGIGQTPMLLLGKSALGNQMIAGKSSPPWAKSVELIYGARRKSLLAGVPDFQAAGFDVRLCTDDGSIGQTARVPDLLDQRLGDLRGQNPVPEIRVVTCGPEIMMQKVAEVCGKHQIACQVSMETPMACGIGICFSCVAKVCDSSEAGWDYKRTCVEGPIFDAQQIHWN